MFRTNHFATWWKNIDLFKRANCKNRVVTRREFIYKQSNSVLVIFRSSSDGKDTFLARINDDDPPEILTKLYEIDIEKPATLVLKNVNESYDGTYEFTLASPRTSTSEVVVVIAGKFHYYLKLRSFLKFL